jgi:hypothetical protein
MALALAACGGDKPSVAAAGNGVPKALADPAVQPAKPDPDVQLARRVASAIDSAKLQGIDVAAADGVVTLWGAVLSARDKSRAAQVAAKVEGVKAVQNKLDVVPGS